MFSRRRKKKIFLRRRILKISFTIIYRIWILYLYCRIRTRINRIRMNGRNIKRIRFNRIRIKGIKIKRVRKNSIRINWRKLKWRRINRIGILGIKIKWRRINRIRIKGRRSARININRIKLNRPNLKRKGDGLNLINYVKLWNWRVGSLINSVAK